MWCWDMDEIKDATILLNIYIYIHNILLISIKMSEAFL